jgi:hypothetical protein
MVLSWLMPYSRPRAEPHRETHGIRNRDDTGYERRVVPGYERRQPRW